MQSALTYSALIMGLAGGPHCVAMCGAACTALTQSPQQPYGIYLYHLGRLCGYATLGAIATFAIQSIAWVSSYSAVLHPLWTFFHVLIFFWGILLLVLARQPIWVDRAGRNIWGHVKKLSVKQGGHFYIGMLWALMPCGLLYSALIIASFNGNPLDGAISMAAFAVGSSASLFLAPWLWLKLKTKAVEPYGMRLAGLLLSGASAWAIWMDLTHNTKVWCN
ncbi:MAG: sulfite exporter TauE/SafE family protein [Methylotenera sp.]|nr:sulfite exporter TauE/SafE family protein [Methylotenera sp.]MDO9232030.1 sulfite exporter TauE/SafE family protein [Methylotenera sp.]MDO9388246.1 sulfite exporter TauE/SafE family protein [Methylotenera sp.]MDP1596609.1 sulfite exporter TauE/SafE family protein [Methylotenera sp.]MDP1755810.1 sulfite exporter TauE/SafE family protein [Methylotenera sp.]